MNAVLERLGRIGIVPVIKIEDAAKAAPLAKALAAGGIPCAEITFRTAAGAEAIRRIVAEAPEVLVGAGTVLDVAQVDAAIGAGASFIVSPGFNRKVVEHCVGRGIPVTPGCSTPSDMERAIELGLDVVKFFPAEQSGGIDYLKAISAPYPGLRFMPTGGVNAGNIVRYISFDKILACGGSWMAGSDLIESGDFDRITALSREAVLNMLGFSLAHVGIGSDRDAAAATGAAKLFSTLFGFKTRDGAASIFAGDGIEVLKVAAPGAHGHVAIGTNSISRAVDYLERAGAAFDHSNAKKDAKGNVFAVYLKDEVLGFGVHLVQRK
jgi:2-dehydro-3-deoxyphosphogluconate aldolase/(4S)-4-hydroxy-2-oxoglutarate aldolase